MLSSHEFRALPIADRRIALELGEGAQRVLRLHPGMEGALVLQHLDATGLAQTRTYGDFVVEGMAWLESDEALAALRGGVPAEASPAIMRTLGLKSVPSQLGEAEVAALGSPWSARLATERASFGASGLRRIRVSGSLAVCSLPTSQCPRSSTMPWGT